MLAEFLVAKEHITHAHLTTIFGLVSYISGQMIKCRKRKSPQNQIRKIDTRRRRRRRYYQGRKGHLRQEKEKNLNNKRRKRF